MSRANSRRCEDRDKLRVTRSLFHCGTPTGFFPFHQTRDSHDLEPKLPCSCDRLDGGGTGCTHVIDDHHADALLTEAFDALACTVSLLLLAHEESMNERIARVGIVGPRR